MATIFVPAGGQRLRLTGGRYRGLVSLAEVAVARHIVAGSQARSRSPPTALLLRHLRMFDTACAKVNVSGSASAVLYEVTGRSFGRCGASRLARRGLGVRLNGWWWRMARRRGSGALRACSDMQAST